MAPVLHRVDLLWERNEISLTDEHLATAIVGRIMAAQYFRFAQPARVPGKVAVVAAGPNELHEIGARMVADFLEIEGWEVTYLGGNVSAGDIVSLVKRVKPFLLSLSITSAFHVEEARQLIRVIKSEPETLKVRVLAGGFFFSCLPRLCQDFVADGCHINAESAASAANTWWWEQSRL